MSYVFANMFNKNLPKTYQREALLTTSHCRYVVYCRTIHDKLRWLEALQEERRRVEADQRSGLDLAKYREKVRQAYISNKGTVTYLSKTGTVQRLSPDSSKEKVAIFG